MYGNNLLSRSVTGAEKYYYLYNAHGDVTGLFNGDETETSNKLYCYEYSQKMDWTYHGFDIPVDTTSDYVFSFDAYISNDADIASTGGTFIANLEYGIWKSFYYDNTKKGTWQHFEFTGKSGGNIIRALLYPSTSELFATKGRILYKNVIFRKNGTLTNLFLQADNNDAFTIKWNGYFTVSNVVISYDYDAFGNIISETGVANNSTLYAGYQHDDESGLYYLNARYYDNVTARFITEDTYTGEANDPLSLNLYTYCSNNPITYTDPSGHKVKLVQTVNLAVGFVKGGYEEYKNNDIGNIKNNLKNASAMINLVKGIASGDIKKNDLKKMGIDTACGDFKYVIKNINIITDNKKYSNAKIEAFGKHLAGAYGEVLNAGSIVIGVAKSAQKLVSAVKGTANVASVANKAEEVVKGTSKVKNVANVASKADVAVKEVSKVNLPSEAELNNAVGEWSRMQKSLATSKSKITDFNTGSIVYDVKTGENIIME